MALSDPILAALNESSRSPTNLIWKANTVFGELIGDDRVAQRIQIGP